MSKKIVKICLNLKNIFFKLQQLRNVL